MPSRNLLIDTIAKIEGNAGLKVVIEDEMVKDLQFIVSDYRRFFTTAVRGRRVVAVPSFLSRICGTCSVAHLFASLMAVESAQGIAITEQTKTLRRLAYDGLMIRDHALHLYFFVLPDILGVDSILDVPDDPNDIGHTLLHDSFDIKRLGTEISDTTVGAAIHAPWPTIGGFLKRPDPATFPDLLARLEAVRPKVLRGIDTFFEWDASLVRNTDYLGLRNDTRFDFLEGDVLNSNGRRIAREEFKDYLRYVQIPHSHAEGYQFSDTGEDYLVGALARINLNRDLLHPRTSDDAASSLSAFPSNNVYHNNLAQAIEILQCVDDAIDILRTIELADEKPVRSQTRAGTGVGLIEAPRGLLYHMAKINEEGIVEDYDVIVPTAQNQINIENDLKDYFNENLDKDEQTLRVRAESIVRAYDPCMSCATNFLKIDWIRR
ncbi:MAG: nickel-dependent hydrogenase large subunit [Actinomycetota bacterium]|nr:nickel-dependent hydrogenase large subunit [Actinomycetota bacterium]